MSRTTLLASLGLTAMLAAACTGQPAGSPSVTPVGGSPSPQPTPVVDPVVTPSPTPIVTPAPTLPPTPSAPPSAPPTGSTGVVVTFQVEAEQFRILVTEQELIAHVQQLLAGGEEGRIPSGVIVRGETGVNEGWSWSIDPQSLEFADMTIEICDGLPSHIEDGTLTTERYCPWGAQVIDVQPAP